MAICAVIGTLTDGHAIVGRLCEHQCHVHSKYQGTSASVMFAGPCITGAQVIGKGGASCNRGRGTGNEIHQRRNLKQLTLNLAICCGLLGLPLLGLLGQQLLVRRLSFLHLWRCNLQAQFKSSEDYGTCICFQLTIVTGPWQPSSCAFALDILQDSNEHR